MLMIECPFCGPRTETEFSYGGQAHVAYPRDPSALSDEQWARFLFYRDNPKGTHHERWAHSAGCRKWFNAVRDTRTYAISRVYRLTDPIKES
jgi:sarcosine oxidase, subunit delta